MSELASNENLAKYAAAGVAARAALDAVRAMCVPGASIHAICAAGDKEILNALAQCAIKAPAETRLAKGVCFPTCVSVNGVFGNFSPSAESTAALREGDVCKIELGAHVDGFVALVGETVVCGSGDGVSDEAARTLQAAIVAAHVALRLLRPGVTNTQLTQAVHDVADTFGVTPIKKLVSYQVKRYVLDGRRQIFMANPEPGDEPLECGAFSFDGGEAYAIDVRMSSGCGELKMAHDAPTVFKRQVDVKYMLRSAAARSTFNEIQHRFPTFAFAMRQLNEQRTARLGVKEMLGHALLQPFDVTLDKRPRAVIACVRFTALIADGRTYSLTPLPEPVLPAGFQLSPLTQYALTLDLANHNTIYNPPPPRVSGAASSSSSSSASSSTSAAAAADSMATD